MGRIAVGADPAGAAYGLWQAKEHTGTDLVDEPGCAVLGRVDEPRLRRRARRFYSDVFGYRLQEIGEGGFRYSVASLDGERAVGGIGAIPAAAPADVPSHWMVYFAVADCDAAAERVTALGGSVMQPPFDTPYGRMALVAGPQGETFSVMQLPEQSTTD